MKLAAFLLSAALWAAVCTPAAAAAPPSGQEPAAIGETAEPADGSFTIDLSIVGDCLLATQKGQTYKGSFSWYAARQEPAYFFEKVYDIFSADDFTIVNLENVLTDRPLKEKEKSTDPAYWFKAPAANAGILAQNSVEAVSLANNHTGDYGEAGRRDTARAVEAAGLPYGTNDETVYLEKNGFTIALICHGLWNEGQASQIIRRLNAAAENSDYQIVFFHGGTEGTHDVEDWKQRACRRLADAGADLVVGCHPHVLQPMEVYNGVNIVYSLGNFCYGGNRRPENRTVICRAVLTVEGGQLADEAVEFIPCYVYTGNTNNWQPAPITDEAERQKVLAFMEGREKLPY